MNRQELAVITEQASGMAACVMMWASQPDVWPAFVAWAEQSVPDETWDSDDREAVRVFGIFLGCISEGLAQ